MESLKENIARVKESLMDLENLFKEGKDRNDAKVKDMEDKIRHALDVPRESWMNTGQTLKDVTENVHKLEKKTLNSSISPEVISEKDFLKNASGGLALEGVYKTRNPEDFLVKREQLIAIPDSFSLTSPKQNTRYEQKEFSSHKSERVFHKVMEKLGYSYSCSLNIGSKGFSFGSSEVERNQFNETEETRSSSQEESYILHTKYNYIPLASAFFQKDELKLSTGAVTALKEIEKVILHCDDYRQQMNTVRISSESFGSHVNQGPLHFGGVFSRRASASGFRSNDLSEVKHLVSESLNVYCGAGYGCGALAVSGKAATSSMQLRGAFTGKHREDLMGLVQLSVSKTGGPPEIDDHMQWKSHLVNNTRTWSLIDKGTTLIPVREIVMTSHRQDFTDVSSLSRIFMKGYTVSQSLSVPLIPSYGVTGEPVPSRQLRAQGQEPTLDRAQIHRRAHTHTHSHSHSHTKGHFSRHQFTYLHVFRLWEETGVPGGNPRQHGENMQTPHRNFPGRPTRGSNPGPSCCEATALSTAPPCCPKGYTDITKENVEEVWGENILSEVEKAETLIQSVNMWSASDCESHLTQLLDLKTKLSEKTGSHKTWFRTCLSDETLQNYLCEVATVHSKSKAVNLKILMRSLLESDLYKLENFPNRKKIMNWSYQTEEDFPEQVSVSGISDLNRILQRVKKELEDSRYFFSSAENDHNAKKGATNTVTLSLNSFCNTLEENGQKEAELLILSIITAVGYIRENKTFNHLLDMNEIVFLQSELQKAFTMYSSLKEQCSIRAQAYMLHTALTVSTHKNMKISDEEKGERLQLIRTQLKNKLSSHIESLIDKSHDDWESLESALDSTVMGTQVSDGSVPIEEVVCQLKTLLVKQVAPLSEVGTTDEQNTPVNNNEKASTFMDLLQKLGLQDSYPKKMTKSEVLVTGRLSLKVEEPQTEEDLCSLYLYKLMTLDYRARYLCVKPVMDLEKDGANAENDDDDLFDFDDESQTVQSRTPAHIHPMDVHMAIFHCSNDFLRQYIFTKLSACQFSLPFIVPNPCTDQVEVPLWALRHIRKSWQSEIQTAASSCGKYHNRQMFNTPVPIVSFIRLGVSDYNSKSQILDGVISKQKHSVFFHRHCKGSTSDSLLMSGVVEIAWYCPGGKEDDIFDECLAFLNLHGDAAEHPKQLEFLQAVSTVIVLLLSEHSMSETVKEVSQKLSKSPVPLICMFSGKDKIQKSKNSTTVRLAAKNRNQAEFTDELISSIKQCISQNKQTATIEMCCEEARKLKFKVDEDKKSCKDGHEKAQRLVCLLKDGSLSTIKERILPLQGEFWHDWCKKDKEQYRLQSKEKESIEQQLSKISAKMTKIRRSQLHAASPLNDFMRSFLECLTTPAHFKDTNMYMLQWLSILLDDLTTDELALLEGKYHSTWKELKNVPKDKEESIVHALQNKLDSIADEMAATTVGLQHIMREVSQLYEAFQMSETGKKNTERYNTLPNLGVSMLLSGYPLEIMDGDAAHVPLTWISAVLTELINTLGDKKVFVLSILGLQSSGKSTLLNTMFGLQFAVSAGRCTQGAFMQLVEVDSSIRNDLGYDFVLIVDTEGLRSPELSTKISLSHDNELATFIIGIGDTTVINIMGENPSEMHDILQICVQAFLRMKQVKITPSCIFVHQNVAEASAGDKNIEGRRRLLEKLDDMARLAAKEENVDGITCFSDVIHFDIDTQVFYFKSLLEGDPPMAPPNPSYSQNVQKLKTKLLTVASWQKCKISSLSEFRCRVFDLWKALLQENFVFSFKNTVEMMVYSSLENKYGDWSWNLRKYSLSLQTELENEIGSDLIQNVSFADLTVKYSEVYNPLKTEIETYFTEDKNKETLIKWKTNIDKRFESLKGELIDGTLKKCNELLHSKKTKSELDRKKTKYTDQLMEQSKKLASTLKTQQPTDERVEKKFDKFWVNWTTEGLNSQPIEDPLNVKAVVEGVLLKSFPNIANIQNIVKDGSFRFDPKKHISQIFWEKGLDWMHGRGNPANDVDVLINNVRDAVHDYITAKENATKDFNENFIYEILEDIEKRIHVFKVKLEKFEFTKEFRVRLSVHLCLRNVTRFEKMHEEFKKANDPLTYLESQREKYLQSFKNYCKGASSVNIFVDFLCKHITPEVLRAAKKKVSQQIADEMKSNNKAFNGNRSNLEYHILKHLATKEDFSMYEEYIDHPKEYFKRFIQEKVDEFLKDDRKLHTIYQENLTSLKNQILTEITTITTEVDEKKGSASMWLNSFCRGVGSFITIKKDELHCIEHEDIKDWQFFKDVLAKSLEEMVKDEEINMEELREEPTTILFQQSEGCWAQCPFCKAICTNTIPNHDEDHSVKFHRCQALSGNHFVATGNFVTRFCTTSVNSNRRFRTSIEGTWIPYKKYRDAGDPYNRWKITGDETSQLYWKWFICTFCSQWENKHGYKFTGRGEIPSEWKHITKQSALNELQL